MTMLGLIAVIVICITIIIVTYLCTTTDKEVKNKQVLLDEYYERNFKMGLELDDLKIKNTELKIELKCLKGEDNNENSQR